MASGRVPKRKQADECSDQKSEVPAIMEDEPGSVPVSVENALPEHVSHMFMTEGSLPGEEMVDDTPTPKPKVEEKDEMVDEGDSKEPFADMQDDGDTIIIRCVRPDIDDSFFVDPEESRTKKPRVDDGPEVVFDAGEAKFSKPGEESVIGPEFNKLHQQIFDRLPEFSKLNDPKGEKKRAVFEAIVEEFNNPFSQPSSQ